MNMITDVPNPLPLPCYSVLALVFDRHGHGLFSIFCMFATTSKCNGFPGFANY